MKREELLQRVKQIVHEIEPDADIKTYASLAALKAHEETERNEFTSEFDI